MSIDDLTKDSGANREFKGQAFHGSTLSTKGAQFYYLRFSESTPLLGQFHENMVSLFKEIELLCIHGATYNTLDQLPQGVTA